MTPFDALFIFFAAMTIVGSLMVIFSKETVTASLFLIFTFVNVAALWMTLQSEFLSLLLIFVYVGAVMTLMLFVVMMLNTSAATANSLPQLVYNTINVMLGIVLMAVLLSTFSSYQIPLEFKDNIHSTKALGQILYTKFALPFCIVSIILFIGMVGAVGVCFLGRRPDRKSQNISKQIYTSKEERLRFVPGKLKGKPL